jgi:hypothetical protein
MFLAATAKAANLCSPLDAHLQQNQVLAYLAAVTSKQPTQQATELLVARDLRQTGLAQSSLLFEVKLPDSDQVVDLITLAPHQSYRGLEVISVDPQAGSVLRDRSGKIIRIFPGDLRPIHVLVMGESRDEYAALMANIADMDMVSYVKRVYAAKAKTSNSEQTSNIHDNMWKIIERLPTHTPSPKNYDTRIGDILSYPTLKDQTNVKGVSSEIVDCEPFVTENEIDEKKVKTPWGAESYFFSCIINDGEQTILCVL